jgi:chemotaxis protein MotB
MSEVKEEHSQAIVESLHKQFGHDMSIVASMPGPVPPTNSAIAKMASMGRAQRANTMDGGDKVKAVVGDNPRVRAIRSGDETTLGGVIQFREGSSELTEANKQALVAIAQIVGGKPQKLEVRTHTTSRPLPPDSPYRDHWDLCYARGATVVKFLVDLGIDEKRFRTVQAGSGEPAHIGDDPEKLLENARAEVFLLDELTSDLEGTKEEREALSEDFGGP